MRLKRLRKDSSCASTDLVGARVKVGVCAFCGHCHDFRFSSVSNFLIRGMRLVPHGGTELTGEKTELSIRGSVISVPPCLCESPFFCFGGTRAQASTIILRGPPVLVDCRLWKKVVGTTLLASRAHE